MFGTTIYLLSSNHREQDFQERLKERVVITEKLFLEKESFGSIELAKITNEFLHTLPEETEEVVQLHSREVPIFKYQYPSSVTERLSSDDFFDFEDAKRQGKGKIFEVDGNNYLIIVTAIDSNGFRNLSFLKKVIILLVLIGLPSIFLLSYLLIYRALLPISKKIAQANKIGASNLHQRLNVENPNDELGKSAIAFNKLLDRLETSFDAQKAFIRNASHEIRNPLTAIMGEAEVAISKSRTNEEYTESMQVILEESEILNSTVNNLLQLSQVSGNEEAIRYEKIDFRKFLYDVKDSFDFVNPNNKIEVTSSYKDQGLPLMIRGNKNLLKTAITNLFDNACKFSSNRKVEVMLTMDDKMLVFTITDIGVGILCNDLDKIISPFYRGKNALKVKGSGIGLSLSSKIIMLHQGQLEIQSKIGTGTKVCVKLSLA